MPITPHNRLLTLEQTEIKRHVLLRIILITHILSRAISTIHFFLLSSIRYQQPLGAHSSVQATYTLGTIYESYISLTRVRSRSYIRDSTGLEVTRASVVHIARGSVSGSDAYKATRCSSHLLLFIAAGRLYTETMRSIRWRNFVSLPCDLEETISFFLFYFISRDVVWIGSIADVNWLVGMGEKKANHVRPVIDRLLRVLWSIGDMPIVIWQEKQRSDEFA